MSDLWQHSGRQLKLDRELLEKLRPIVPSAPLAGELADALSNDPFCGEKLDGAIERLKTANGSELSDDLFWEELALNAADVEERARQIKDV